ncbi:MAG TPA: hypothetical protein VI913_00135 [Candidatus Peribacteraceae bacterium]|nr:hypothetical protein [Candidatus Peribacteraceae bacterium]
METTSIHEFGFPVVVPVRPCQSEKSLTAWITELAHKEAVKCQMPDRGVSFVTAYIDLLKGEKLPQGDDERQARIFIEENRAKVLAVVPGKSSSSAANG